MRSIDITGQKIGRLIVLERLPNSPGGHSQWKCRCDCGSVLVTRGASLSSGHTVSCGCAQRVAARRQGKRNATHGHNRRSGTSPTYITWIAMKARCENPRHRHFENYGGRGIAICERWQTFTNFLDDMGERPIGTSIDRIDGSRGYEPGNCRWATRSEQNRNRRGVHVAA